MPKRRYAILTWNNPPSEAVQELKQHADSEGDLFSYVVGQLELGKECKTPHIQAAVYARKGLNFKAICATFRGCVLKAYNDDASAMLSYVQKEDTRVGDSQFSGGIAPVDATKKRRLAEAITTGEIKTEKEAMLQYPNEYLRHSRGVPRMLQLLYPPNKDFMKLDDVIVLWGPTGMGKTRLAREGAKKHGVDFFEKSAGTGQWWDGYNDEPYIIIDEMEGQATIDFRVLLQLTGGYGVTVQNKGGMKYIKPRWVVLTSNKHPDNWYIGVDTAPLKRRITQTLHINEPAYDDIAATAGIATTIE